MSDETFGFAPPPFKPDEALQRLRRELRGLGLEEREGAFERRGLRMARAALADGELVAAVARQPARSPEWQQRRIASSADLRDFVADLKKRIAGWSERDE
ncbi:hypothetical protein [Piscinibacter sakaiensis]|uniref:hypothetical protein n=1 Tax=Piscinibacter sakaiensis TaxID=1547922 RepID=UPI003AAE8575